jgi:hypothetical protein
MSAFVMSTFVMSPSTVPRSMAMADEDHFA